MLLLLQLLQLLLLLKLLLLDYILQVRLIWCLVVVYFKLYLGRQWCLFEGIGVGLWRLECWELHALRCWAHILILAPCLTIDHHKRVLNAHMRVSSELLLNIFLDWLLLTSILMTKRLSGYMDDVNAPGAFWTYIPVPCRVTFFKSFKWFVNIWSCSTDYLIII